MPKDSTSTQSDVPLRILLVEDSPHDQIAFERSLVKAGLPFSLTVCQRAEDMADVIKEDADSFDIVVVDHDLPGRSGLEMYLDFRKRMDLPPFMMLTGAGSESLAVEALQAGVYDYLVKDPKQGYLKILPLKLANVRKRYEDHILRLEAEKALEMANSHLENLVEQRTEDLAQTVKRLEEEISERLKTEEALRHSEQALRLLSLKIVDTQENERRQLAKELHDSIGASLSAIKFFLEENIASRPDTAHSDGTSLKSIVGYIQNTIQEVRRISMSLRPSQLDDMGLVAAMQWYCRSSGKMYANTRIETQLSVAEYKIPHFAKVVIYRVMQEALNNALKHSKAANVQVRLAERRGCILLCVKDNGCGFDPEDPRREADPMSGFGLKGMRERAEVVRGDLSIDTRPDQGTVVCLELPLNGSTSADAEPAAI